MSYSSVVMIGGEPYLRSVGYVWDTGTLSWIPGQQPGGSGGGGAVTVANGADVAQGNTGDTAWVSGAGTVISILKKIASAGGSAVSVADGADVAQGAVADATWSGSGAGSVVAILKALWAKLNGTLAVSGTFWQTTQPVSLATAPLPTNAATESGHLAAIDTSTAKIPAQGQALAAASLPVVLTAIQQAALTPPAAITGFALDATVAKDGTDISAPTAMPAGGVGIRGWLSAIWTKLNGTIGVTGTFWQATQPVSIAATVNTNTGLTQPLTDTQLRASAVPISLATNTPDVTDRAGRLLGIIASIAAAIDISDRAGRLLGVVTNANLDVALSTRLKPADTLAGVTTVAAVTTITNALPGGTNKLGTVDVATAPATAKGTQGANGVPTQHLHDAGRNTRIFMLDAYTVAPVAEALQAVVQWYGNAAVAGTATPAVVPAGKTLRLLSYKIMYQSLATVGYAVVRVRANTAGVAALASPLVASFEAGSGSGSTTVAMTGGLTVETGDFPDGLELPAGTGVGFTLAGYGPTGTLTLEGGVRFQVFGYEY